MVEVTTEGIELTAASVRGLNWATQTLRQLLPPSALRPAPTGEPLSVAGVRITDEPRFGWRGVHLDVGRHFMPLADLFRFVDLIALHKYNVFHLHLTEDQGWRFASDRYPKLQERASWRTETQRHFQDFADGTPHGGFYTHDQLRALVRYAGRSRGHGDARARVPRARPAPLLAAYPELGNHPETGYEPATTFGVFPEVLNLSDEAMAVVFDLYAELLEVFDSPYVHVGGDECPRDGVAGQPRAPAASPRSVDCRVRSTCSAGSPSSCGTGWPPAAAGWSAGTRSTTRVRSRVPSPWRGGTRRTGSRRRRPGWT